ncbi:hypothetical protein ACFQX8_07975 [Klenkia terrae]|uniref:hypothetical protein n=1 Tax=Klenkia terrae TaxID=1052259 RepID=UPI00361CBD38
MRRLVLLRGAIERAHGAGFQKYSSSARSCRCSCRSSQENPSWPASSEATSGRVSTSQSNSGDP